MPDSKNSRKIEGKVALSFIIEIKSPTALIILCSYFFFESFKILNYRTIFKGILLKNVPISHN